MKRHTHQTHNHIIMEDKINEIGHYLDDNKEHIRDEDSIKIYEMLKELHELREQTKIPVKCFKHMVLCVNDSLKIFTTLIDRVVLLMTQEEYEDMKQYPRFKMFGEEIEVDSEPFTITTILPDEIENCAIDDDRYIYEIDSYYTLRF